MKALQQSSLYFAKFDTFNDPAEGVDADIEVIPKGFETVMGLLLKNADHGKAAAKWAGARAKMAATSYIDKETCGVCCFSQSGLQQALWAYYANDHKGICIEYNVDTLFSTEICWGNKISKVAYNDKRQISLSEAIEGKNTNSSLLTKSRDWEHEGEWRCFLKDRDGLVFHAQEAIVAITLGSRINPDEKQAVVKAAQVLGCEVRQAYFSGYIMQEEIILKRQTNRGLSKPLEGGVNYTSSVERYTETVPDFPIRKNALLTRVKNLPYAHELWFFSYDKETDDLFLHLSVLLGDGTEAERIISELD